MKSKEKKVRNWHAVNAFQRTSAGPMKDRRRSTDEDWEALDEAQEQIEESRALRERLNKKYNLE